MKLRWEGYFAAGLILFFVIVALAAPLISPALDDSLPSYNQVGSARDKVPHAPAPGSPLGTVPGQWDVFHSLVWGTRDALKFGLGTALISALAGVLIGSLSAYAGGTLNRVVMRITDGFLTFPLIAAIVSFNLIFGLLAQEVGVGIRLTASGVFEQNDVLSNSVPTFFIQNLFDLLIKSNPFFLAVICFSWMPFARLINSEILRLKKSEFVVAGRALGARNSRILFRHLLPNSIAPLIVLAARDVGAMVALQATFVYIGLTSGSPWAMIMVTGKNWVIGPGGSLTNYWWIFLPSTLALILFGAGWNLLGDELNYLMSPKKPGFFSKKAKYVDKS